MKRIVFITGILLLALSLPAQKVTLQVSKTKVTVGEPFQVTVTVEGGGKGMKIGNINEFDVFQGPFQSQSIQYVNGTMSQTASLTYVIGAKKEGKITLGPATVNSGGNTITSNPVTIEVAKGSGNSGQQAGTPPNTQPQNPSTPTSEDPADNLFIKTTVSKTKAYQGEQITVIQKVYSRYQFRGFEDVKFPDYTGFYSQDVPMSQMTVVTENVDGINYSVIELKRSYLFAQRSGKIEIPPVEAECVVRRKSSRKPRDVFEQLFGGGYEDVMISVKGKSLTLDILPLPEEGKPADFSGAVGEYSFKAQLNKDKVKANESINLTLSLSGKGNLKLIDPPKVGFPEDFETYDPKTSENINVGASNVSGSKTFDYLLIPRHEGDYTINQLNFTYFDPAKKTYVTLPGPDFSIHVEKGDGEQATVVGSSDAREDLKVLGNDIRYIKKDMGELRSRDDHFFGSGLFYSLLSAPFAAFFLFVFFRRKQVEQNKDVVAVKSRKATRMARKRLALAEKHIRAGNKEAFYVEIFRALYGYIGDKMNIPVADLNRETISQTLKNRNVTDESVAKLMKTLDSCEYARYAPGAVSGDLQGIYNDTVELITNIEDEVS